MKCLRVALLFFCTFIVHTASSLLHSCFNSIAHPSNGSGLRYDDRHNHHKQHVVVHRRGVRRYFAATKKSSSATTTDPNYWYNENDPLIIVDHNQIHTSGMLTANSKNREEEASIEQPITLREQLLQHNIDLSQSNNNNNNNPKCIKFTIRGNPRVLIRHRTARGFVYNPSKASQDNFRNVLLEMLPTLYHPTILDDDYYCNEKERDTKKMVQEPAVLFTQDEYLSLSLTFRMKRPKSHFINNKPGRNRLKKEFASTMNQYSNIRSDIDNLCKFVMDTMNGLLYVDDRQVVQLNAMKVLDNEDECLGATEVEIRVL